MKKVLTIAVAAVMAFSLSMPAFAAATEGQMANEGKLVQQIGHALAQDNVEAATAAAEEVVTLITDGKTDVSALTAGHLQAVLNKANGTSSVSNVDLGDGEQALVGVVGEGGTAANVTMNSVSINNDGGKVSSIVFTATASGEQSALGYLMNLTLPASALGDTEFAKGDMHLIYNDNGVNQKLDSVTGITYRGTDVVITFWVPHFSTYTLSVGSATVTPPELPSETPPPPTEPEQPAPAPAATPAPAPAPAAANPIKKTGADMSVALTALAVVAGVALVGGVVAMKKSDLDQ